MYLFSGSYDPDISPSLDRNDHLQFLWSCTYFDRINPDDISLTNLTSPGTNLPVVLLELELVELPRGGPWETHNNFDCLRITAFIGFIWNRKSRTLSYHCSPF